MDLDENQIYSTADTLSANVICLRARMKQTNRQTKQPNTSIEMYL